MTDQSEISEGQAGGTAYRVLARKYRPGGFAELIGQDAMVRTLTNAIRSGRLAHAFMLTGVRGVGKTTTARIIARALNCIGPDGDGGPTPDPCGVCEHCRAIAEDRHVDVLEMDAASRTGVDDIRELTEGVRYRPTSARFKVYIIDEVHMLTRHAFNALLKTLEEPPEHTKFVFATTEQRKVPVTVLSRCQRFDLRRVDMACLSTHFAAVAKAEEVSISAAALDVIARAADGSVRDGLSLLDQAIAHCGNTVEEKPIRQMLGLADRTQTFDLLDGIFKGEIAQVLGRVSELYQAGADPTILLEDMLELTHWLTRVKVVPEAAEEAGVAEAERVRGRMMAEGLSMAALSRAWQMLLKGLAEARTAAAPLWAAEMVLVRLAYAADLPTPAEMARSLEQSGDGRAAAGPPPATAAPEVGPAPQAQAPQAQAPQAQSRPPVPQTWEAVVALADSLNERVLLRNLRNDVHLIRFEPGTILFRPTEGAPPDLDKRLRQFLDANSGRRWSVEVSNAEGAATMHQQAEVAEAATKAEASEHPLVKSVLETFPGAAISTVRTLDPGSPTAEDRPREDSVDDSGSPFKA